MGLFYSEQGEVWEQNRLRHYLKSKYLGSYERIIKEKIAFSQKKNVSNTH